MPVPRLTRLTVAPVRSFGVLIATGGVGDQFRQVPEMRNVVSSARVEALDVKQGFQSVWHGVSLVCVHCATVLGVAIDPIALKTDIVKEVARALREGRERRHGISIASVNVPEHSTLQMHKARLAPCSTPPLNMIKRS